MKGQRKKQRKRKRKKKGKTKVKIIKYGIVYIDGSYFKLRVAAILFCYYVFLSVRCQHG